MSSWERVSHNLDSSSFFSLSNIQGSARGRRFYDVVMFIQLFTRVISLCYKLLSKAGRLVVCGCEQLWQDQAAAACV